MCRAYIEPEATGQRRLRSRDWVSAYGILQRIETVMLDEDGRQTANSRSNVRFKELPGGSPAMLPWLLNRSVFLSLGDMGLSPAGYTEIPVSVPMAPAQAVLYEDLKEQLKEELKERLIRGINPCWLAIFTPCSSGPIHRAGRRWSAALVLAKSSLPCLAR